MRLLSSFIFFVFSRSAAVLAVLLCPCLFPFSPSQTRVVCFVLLCFKCRVACFVRSAFASFLSARRNSRVGCFWPSFVFVAFKLPR